MTNTTTQTNGSATEEIDNLAKIRAQWAKEKWYAHRHAPVITSYELSHYYLGNKPQHRGYDESDRYSGEYRVAQLKMSDGSIAWGLWVDGDLFGDKYGTEMKARKALRSLWMRMRS